jgi:hypothetical protein
MSSVTTIATNKVLAYTLQPFGIQLPIAPIAVPEMSEEQLTRLRVLLGGATEPTSSVAIALGLANLLTLDPALSREYKLSPIPPLGLSTWNVNILRIVTSLSDCTWWSPRTYPENIQARLISTVAVERILGSYSAWLFDGGVLCH